MSRGVGEAHAAEFGHRLFLIQITSSDPEIQLLEMAQPEMCGSADDPDRTGIFEHASAGSQPMG